MKKFFYFGIILAAVWMAACIRISGENISGIGSLDNFSVTKFRFSSLEDTTVYKALDDFSVFVNNTILDVEVVEGEPGITITGKPPVVKALRVIRKGHQLTLGSEGDPGFSGEERIVVSGRMINELCASFSGSIHASRVSGDAVTLRVGGSGTVRVDKVEASSVRMNCGGSGDVIVPILECVTAQLMVIGSGDVTVTQAEAVNMKALVQGAGDITVRKLTANTVDATVQGSGDIAIRELEANSLRAVVQGSGDISLQGAVNTSVLTVQGSGDIHTRGLKSDRVSKSVQGVGDIN